VKDPTNEFHRGQMCLLWQPVWYTERALLLRCPGRLSLLPSVGR